MKRIAALCLWLVPAVTWATSLAVTPVRIELSDKKPYTTVHVTNAGDDRVTVQVHPANWVTAGVEDSLSDTDDVVVNPPVFTLAPGQKQIIRLGLRNRQHTESERTYRLVLDEVPKPPKAGSIATVLRITVPIFSLPPRSVAPQLRCKTGMTDDGHLKLTITNQGSAHDRIKEILVDTDADHWRQTLSDYVLAGGQREIVLRDAPVRSKGSIDITVVSETGTMHEAITPTTR